MSEFNRKNKNNFWHSPLILMVLFGILVLFTFSIVGLSEKERETSQKKDIELTKIENLRLREKTLNQDIEKLKTEEGIEETIRDKYQVVKPNEKMVTIIDEENKQLMEVPEVTNHGFIGWIKSIFIKK
jgi:cell division protein FtsB